MSCSSKKSSSHHDDRLGFRLVRIDSLSGLTAIGTSLFTLVLLVKFNFCHDHRRIAKKDVYDSIRYIIIIIFITMHSEVIDKYSMASINELKSSSSLI